MSNLLNKAKDALSGNKGHNEHHDNPRSTNDGPHSSNIANKGDPRIDSDRDNRNDPTSRVGGYGDQSTSGTYGTTGTTGTGHHGGTHGAGVHHATTTSGGYGSSTTNDPGYNNPQSVSAGPHSSNLANKLDPRVDSDRDNRNDPTSRVGGYGDQGTSGGYTSGAGTTGAGYGSTGTHGQSGGYGTTGGYDGSTTAGPHSSNFANKADPRVDSDLDGSRTSGYGNTGSTGAGYGSTGTHGTSGGYGTTGTTGGYGGSTTAGPHSSNIANKADPRVDSDLDGSRTNQGYGSTGAGYGSTGTHGTHSTTGGYGQTGTTGAGGYGQSGTTGAAGYGQTGDQTVGSGRSDNAGPPHSNLLNKLDPRVDSDLSGGKTYGGNATHQ